MLLVLAASSARAAEDGRCTGAIDLDGPVALATVSGPGRVPFLKASWQDAACPSTAARCRDAAYLVAGDAVVVTDTTKDFSCATYVGAKGATRTGWIARDALKPASAPSVRTDDWIGSWVSGPEQTIAIARKGEELALSGEASYGTQDPERVKRGAVNMGSFGATARPAGASLGFTETETGTKPYESGDDTTCRIRMRLVPPFLVAQSNTACGGMNVTFSGIYRRKG